MVKNIALSSMPYTNIRLYLINPKYKTLFFKFILFFIFL